MASRRGRGGGRTRWLSSMDAWTAVCFYCRQWRLGFLASLSLSRLGSLCWADDWDICLDASLFLFGCLDLSYGGVRGSPLCPHLRHEHQVHFKARQPPTLPSRRHGNQVDVEARQLPTLPSNLLWQDGLIRVSPQGIPLLLPRRAFLFSRVLISRKIIDFALLSAPGTRHVWRRLESLDMRMWLGGIIKTPRALPYRRRLTVSFA